MSALYCCGSAEYGILPEITGCCPAADACGVAPKVEELAAGVGAAAPKRLFAIDPPKEGAAGLEDGFPPPKENEL